MTKRNLEPTVVDGVSYWQCTRCKQYKTKEEFIKNHARKYGITGECILCNRKFFSERRERLRAERQELEKAREQIKNVEQWNRRNTGVFPSGVSRERRLTKDGKYLLQCTKCKEWKEENEFYPNPQQHYGRNSYCIACFGSVKGKLLTAKDKAMKAKKVLEPKASPRIKTPKVVKPVITPTVPQAKGAFVNTNVSVQKTVVVECQCGKKHYLSEQDFATLLNK